MEEVKDLVETEKKENNKKINKLKIFFKGDKWKIIFNFFIFPLLIVILTDIYFKLSLGGGFFKKIGDTIYRSSEAFFITYILIVCFNGLLTAITNSSRKAMIIIMTFFIILLPVNDFKFHIMGEPVKVSDVNFLNSSNTDMMVNVMDTLKGSWMTKTIVKSIISIVLFVLLIWADGKVIFKFKDSKKRIINLIIFAFFTVILVIPPLFLRSFIIGKLFNDDDKKDYRRNTTNEAVYREYGFVQGLYYSFLSDHIMAPEGYSDEKADKIMADSIENVDEQNKENWGKPDVVFILSESFWDISQLEEIKFDKNLTSNIDRLEETNRCLSFNMLSPSYGGASTNVEFEILTGGSISFFNNGYIPYLQLYKGEKAKKMPNLIHEFNNEDYYTRYISSWGRTSYNSEKVFKLMGVDESSYEDDLVNPIKKGNIADSYMMDVILENLKSRSGEKKFLFTTTAQNHMPYSKQRYSNYDVNVESSNLSSGLTDVARCFAQGVYDADKELGRLYDEIQKLDRPTVVVFFGDHLPYLDDTDGESIEDVASYFNTDDSNLNDMRKHLTQCVIVTNFDIEKDDSAKIMNANYIGSYLLSKLDFDRSDYFKYIESVRTQLPVYNKNFVYKDDSFENLFDLDKNLEKILDEKKIVQYRAFMR